MSQHIVADEILIDSDSDSDSDSGRMDLDNEVEQAEQCFELTEQECNRNQSIRFANKIFMQAVDQIDKKRETLGYKPHPPISRNKMLTVLRRGIFTYASDHKEDHKYKADYGMLISVDNNYAHNFNVLLAYETARLHLTKTKKDILGSTTLLAIKLKVEENTPLVQLLENLQKHYNETTPQNRIFLFSKVSISFPLIFNIIFSTAYEHPCTKHNVHPSIVEILESIQMDKNSSPLQMWKSFLITNETMQLTVQNVVLLLKFPIDTKKIVLFVAPIVADMAIDSLVNWLKRYSATSVTVISGMLVVMQPIQLQTVINHGQFVTK